jgi:hypothetical protein
MRARGAWGGVKSTITASTRMDSGGAFVFPPDHVHTCGFFGIIYPVCAIAGCVSYLSVPLLETFVVYLYKYGADGEDWVNGMRSKFELNVLEVGTGRVQRGGFVPRWALGSAMTTISRETISPTTIDNTDSNFHSLGYERGA